MIRLVRVDHRLLHGQVAFSWTNSVNADCILVASDQVVNDEIWKTTLKLGKPAGVKLVIKNMQDAIGAINSGITDKYRLLVVVQTIEDAYALAKHCPSVRSINLGGTKKREGDQQFGKAIFMNDNELNLMKDLIGKGIEVEIRQLANEQKLILNDTLK